MEMQSLHNAWPLWSGTGVLHNQVLSLDLSITLCCPNPCFRPSLHRRCEVRASLDINSQLAQTSVDVYFALSGLSSIQKQSSMFFERRVYKSLQH